MDVFLFGTLAIDHGSRRLGPADLGGRKPKQILEILLTQRGHVVSKDRIADLLWPEGGPEHPAAAIDTYVSVLRRHLEPAAARARDCQYVRSVHPGYLFDTAGATIDVDRFERLVAAGREASETGELERGYRSYREALDLHRGVYLEDEPFAAWTEEPRRSLERAYLTLLLASAELALRRGNFPAGLELAERAIEHDPLNETAYRTAMLCGYALGRQDEALRVYRRCRQALVEELGVDPAAETDELHARILAGTPVARLLAPLADEPRRREPAALEVPFLGRRAELAVLLRAWHSTVERPVPGVRLAVIQGEAGIGKSRLVGEFLRRTGIRCARAKCTELERDLPFSGLAAALADLFRGLTDAEAERALAAGPAVCELVPELGGAGMPPMTALPPEAARIRLLDSVAAVLAAAAPVMLFLDDLHWADASTVQAVGRILQRVQTAPILLLTGIRPGEAGQNPPVGRLIEAARSAGRLHVIELVPLSQSAFEALLPLGVDPAQLWAATGGHPLFLTERLRAGTGERLDEAILSRCQMVEPPVRRTLEAAAIFERAFRLGHLADVLERDDTAVADDLEDLLSRKLLIESGGELTFSHDLVRDTIYQSMSGPRREALHRRALRTLEREGVAPAELAGHALAGGVWNAAVRYAAAAGDRALSLYANTEAAVHFERALDVLQSHPGLAGAEQLERLLMRRAQALIVLGQTDEALSLLERAASSARDRGDLRTQVEVEHWLGHTHWSGWYPSRALPHAHRALDLAERLGDEHLIGRAHGFLANPHGSLGHLDQALKHANRAREIFAHLGEEPPAQVLYRMALVYHHRGQESMALEVLRRGEALARAQHDEIILVFVHWVRAMALANLGRYQDAFAAVVAAESAGKGEEVFARSRLPNTRASFYADLDLWEEARERDFDALDAIQSMGGAGVQEPRLQTLLNLAEDELMLNRTEAAGTAVAEVERMVPHVEYGRWRYQNRLHYVRGLLALAQDDPHAALAAAADCLGLAAEYAAPKNEVRGRLVRGRALARLGQAEEAEGELVATAELAERLGYPTWVRRTWNAVADLTDSSRARRRAQAAARTIADGLDTELREQFTRVVARVAR